MKEVEKSVVSTRDPEDEISFTLSPIKTLIVNQKKRYYFVQKHNNMNLMCLSENEARMFVDIVTGGEKA